MTDSLQDTGVGVNSAGGVLQVNFNLNLVVILNGTASYTPSANAKTLICEAIGGGGSGGAVQANAAGTQSIAGGGGGGGAAIKRLAAPLKASYFVTVGAGGAVAGGAGNDGTFTALDNPAVLLAPGGKGGAVGLATAPPFIPAAPGLGGDFAAVIGDTGFGGCPGTYGGFNGSTVLPFGGAGGAAARGGGGVRPVAVANGGSAAGLSNNQGWGGGGGGGVSSSPAGSVSGGAGANGVLLITEVQQFLA